LAEFRHKRKFECDPDTNNVVEDDVDEARLVLDDLCNAFGSHDKYIFAVSETPRAVSKFFRELAERLERGS